MLYRTGARMLYRPSVCFLILTSEYCGTGGFALLHRCDVLCVFYRTDTYAVPGT